MQALSAEIRYSCGLAKRFEPPSSRGSSMSIEKRRVTSWPPISKPSTWLRLRVWPCQVVVTCQRVAPFTGSRLTLSISENRSSTLMPLTTFGAVVIALPSMTDLLCLAWVGGKCTTGSVQRGEGCLNALALALGDQAGEHLGEMRMPGPRMDVLPAIGSEEGGLDRPRLVGADRAPAIGDKVAGIGSALRLQNSIHCGNQLDEFVHRPVALLRHQCGVLPRQFELVEDRVLALLLPVIEEHVLVELRQFGVGIDALAVVSLREQLDIQCQDQYRPGAFAEHGAGDSIRVDVETVAVGQNLADHCLDAAEQRLMFQLLVAEPHQRLDCLLVAERMIAAQLQDLGVDEAFDQPKDVGVGAALNLAHEPLFVGRQGRERAGERKPVRQKFVTGIEMAAPDHIFVDIPPDPLRRRDAAGVPAAIEDPRWCNHPLSPYLSALPALSKTDPPMAQAVSRRMATGL